MWSRRADCGSAVRWVETAKRVRRAEALGDDQPVTRTGVAEGLVDDPTIARFHDDGYAVLRRAFDPSELSAEVDDALRSGLRADGEVKPGAGGVEFRSVVMMCELTPVSLALLDALSVLAVEFLGWRVLPGRAKGTRYFGSSRLHADSDVTIPSLGFVAYLEPVDATSGALRVLPRSHRHAGAAARSTAGACNDAGRPHRLRRAPDAWQRRWRRAPTMAGRLRRRPRRQCRRSAGARELCAAVRPGLGWR